MNRESLISMAFILPIMMSMPAIAEEKGHSPKINSAKKIVTEFFDLAYIQRLPTEAAIKYISSEKYTQHNPTGKDGREAFINGFGKYIKESNYTYAIKRIIAEDDLVVIHSQGFVNPNDAKDLGEAVIDIYRVEKDKIVEHWDVIQLVPEKSANKNTMF
ncbi:nuclear transport factor 2 family protein [Marinomonas sp. 15G1-11]|uniref:Nuclear transport factor 2 family protein n=1 Tax=Marinomonas phaeophyticola TaxID=3004091 RepID=A0ABT4JUZ4_9GAMM|nr:nuclear transport factor 2 family protein [Marinomonas sp. 15G1-11]MCZ2722215.1 nuclear transport factor 2 family protein [Marinomonas sp. 15G1-11]